MSTLETISQLKFITCYGVVARNAFYRLHVNGMELYGLGAGIPHFE